MSTIIASKSLLNIWHANAHQQQSIQPVNVVPEVDYNYKEFQEPFIGISK